MFCVSLFLRRHGFMFCGFVFRSFVFAALGLRPSKFCVSRFCVRGFVFRGFVFAVFNVDHINEIFSNAISKILEIMANIQMRRSNWRFMAVVKLDVNTVTYKPLKVSSYIWLPVELANKKAIINMKNDDECFKWCITRALNPTDNNPQRITNKLIEQSKKLD